MGQSLMVIESVLKMPLLSLPVKSYLVQTKDGLVLISPVPDIQDFVGQIGDLGTVTDIVAPNGFHHLGIAKAMEVFPQARVWGVPAVIQKRLDINWQKNLFEDPWPYEEELHAIALRGMPKLDEVVFFHQSSNSLIVADFCFNYLDGRGLGYWLMFNLFGTYKRFGLSKLLVRMIDNKADFNSSIEKIMSLDFDSILLPHGIDVKIDAKETLQKALQERGLSS